MASWRSVGSGMCPRSPIDLKTAGGREACAYRRRLPGGRMRLETWSWRVEAATSERGCAHPQSLAACANSPSVPKKRAVGNQRFVVGSTTTTMHRAEHLCFWPAARLDSTSRSSARQSRRGCGLWGGWDAGAASAAVGRYLCLTRDGADRASSGRALEALLRDLGWTP